MTDKNHNVEENDTHARFVAWRTRWRQAAIDRGEEVDPRYKRTLAFWLFERGLFGSICLHIFLGLFCATFVFVELANEDAPPSLQSYTAAWGGFGWILEHAENPNFASARQVFWWTLWMFFFRLLGVIWLRYVGTVKPEKYGLADEEK